MSESHLNARSITGTKTRERDVCYTSGMCPICIRECANLCEIGKAAFRGREVLYPQPEYFGDCTAASNKDYFLDWSHFQILVAVIGAQGIEADSDKAIFPAVNVETSIGGVPLKMPMLIAGLGSTNVADKYWTELAVGAAISGTIQTVGENVCGMDPEAQFTDGKVTYSKNLKHRIDVYREFWDGKYGDIVVQTNVEDERFGVDVYALSKLEVNVIERKWGQGAKAIGGEVRISNLDRAIMLKKRGYIVIPDPEDPNVQSAFRQGTFKTFERHSRMGMPNREDFLEGVDKLREQGARHVFLKTGAYRPAQVAFTMKLASEAKIDAITFDGAGGGTGMSPVPMMQECGTPTVPLEAQVVECAKLLKNKNKHVPDIAIAGGFSDETQIFKAIAMSNFGNGPYVKAIAMARAPIAAVMRASYFVELAEKNKLPATFEREYGSKPEQFFICTTELKNRFGDKFKRLPPGAIGLYSYCYDKVRVGLKQLMAGVRKWKLNLLSRDDLASLTERAYEATGIPLIENIDGDQIKSILG